MSLTVASINIERSKHLARVASFVNYHKPDVLCLQELCARDIPFFEGLLGGKLLYAPMCLHAAEVDLETIGTALVSRHPLQNPALHYYHGNGQTIVPIRFHQHGEQKVADNDSIANALVCATVQGFRIATTHLNVTLHGESTPYQLASAAKLLAAAQAEAATHGGLLLTGDFNAPRGRPTFSLLASQFTDGVPPHYTTSIDGTLHRAGPIPLMVDGLFHTPTYTLTNAALHTGVSDHCALTTTLSKS